MGECGDYTFQSHTSPLSEDQIQGQRQAGEGRRHPVPFQYRDRRPGRSGPGAVAAGLNAWFAGADGRTLVYWWSEDEA